jgi:hypothetical protein
MFPGERIQFYYAFYGRIQLAICRIIKNIEDITFVGVAVGVT